MSFSKCLAPIFNLGKHKSKKRNCNTLPKLEMCFTRISAMFIYLLIKVLVLESPKLF